MGGWWIGVCVWSYEGVCVGSCEGEWVGCGWVGGWQGGRLGGPAELVGWLVMVGGGWASGWVAC